MKKYFIKTLLLFGPVLFLLAGNSLHAEAANPTLYMPHVDAFTYAAAGAADLPEATEYTHMIMADVTDFVNIRQEPDVESGIVGRLYAGAVADMVKFSSVDSSWAEITSGEVHGYVKAEFFLMGTEAASAIEARLAQGEELTYARSMDDILAEIAAKEAKRQQKAREEAQRLAAAQSAKAASEAAVSSTDTVTTEMTSDDAAAADTSELRQSIVEFAMQYLGGPYVHGGNSLTKGTDCSGFTSLVFAEFGYSLSRTPSGQLSGNGTKIEYSEIQPGDIICYTSNGKTCTHVALYIGDGLIIHAANSKKGIITGDAGYSTIMGVKNIIG